MSLSAEDRAFIKAVVETAIAKALRSEARSAAGIAALVGDDQCDEATNRGYMDRTSMETSGDCMSLQEAEEDGRQFIESIQRGILPKPRSVGRARKRKALP